MSISEIEIRTALARSVSFAPDGFTVELADGRIITIPLAWFPRLVHGSDAERANWRLIGHGEGIHWPDLDEDISIESLLVGRSSQERPESIHAWLASRSGR